MPILTENNFNFNICSMNAPIFLLRDLDEWELFIDLGNGLLLLNIIYNLKIIIIYLDMMEMKLSEIRLNTNFK